MATDTLTCPIHGYQGYSPACAECSRDSATRPLYVIAREIRATWPKVWFGAAPYLDAMASLDSVRDSYGYDSADSIVRYFLSNATTWRGEDARRIKKELKAML